MSEQAISSLKNYFSEFSEDHVFNNLKTSVVDLVLLQSMFSDDSERPSLDVFLSTINHLDMNFIDMLSNLLLFYLPSAEALNFDSRDPNYDYINILKKQLREEDRSSLIKIYSNQFKIVNDINTTSIATILMAMHKCSGLLNVENFNNYFDAFQKNYGLYPTELVSEYEEDDISPNHILRQFFRFSAVFLEPLEFAKLLTVMCDKKDQNYFDLAILWIKHSDLLEPFNKLSYPSAYLALQHITSTFNISMSKTPQYHISTLDV